MGITLEVWRNGFDHQGKVKVRWWEVDEELTQPAPHFPRAKQTPDVQSLAAFVLPLTVEIGSL